MKRFNRTRIIAGFPGVGKTYLFNNQEKLGLDILDSDSSNFSWSSPGVRHPDFPNNYIDHILENLGKYDAILISTHKEVRDELNKRNVEYIIVMPKIEDKDLYLKRFEERGSPNSFIEMMNDKWEIFLAELISEKEPIVSIMYSDETLYQWIYRTRIYRPD